MEVPLDLPSSPEKKVPCTSYPSPDKIPYVPPTAPPLPPSGVPTAGEISEKPFPAPPPPPPPAISMYFDVRSDSFISSDMSSPFSSK